MKNSTLNFATGMETRGYGRRWNYLSGFLALLLAAGLSQGAARAQGLSLRIPPVKIPFNVKDEAITVVASGMISMLGSGRDEDIFKIELNANLADLQQNMTPLMSAELDKSDDCGDRIMIEHARIDPAEPASVAVVQLHYERWACVKIFGKRQSKRLVGGDAVIHLKLTPTIEENNAELQLIPEVGEIDADGSLGELLRSGTLGDMLRDKIRESILSAMQKGTDLSATIPAAAQGHVSIQDARFKNAGGQLMVSLAGEIRISKEQEQLLIRELKDRLPTR